MVFVFDLDDTLSETDEYSKICISKFIAEHNLPIKQICENPRFADDYFDWSRDEALDWYLKYGDEMMLNFPPKAGAVETINALYDAGHRIVIATARANDWHVEAEKISLMWLEKFGIKYHKAYIGRTDKDAICTEENANVFVDDDFSHISKAVAYFSSLSDSEQEKNQHNHSAHSLYVGDKQAFLMTTNFNKDKPTPSGAIRINSLDELLDIYLNENEIKPSQN